MSDQSCSHLPDDEWVTALCVTHIDENHHMKSITTAGVNYQIKDNTKKIK